MLLLLWLWLLLLLLVLVANVSRRARGNFRVTHGATSPPNPVGCWIAADSFWLTPTRCSWPRDPWPATARVARHGGQARMTARLAGHLDDFRPSPVAWELRQSARWK